MKVYVQTICKEFVVYLNTLSIAVAVARFTFFIMFGTMLAEIHHKKFLRVLELIWKFIKSTVEMRSNFVIEMHILENLSWNYTHLLGHAF